VLKNIGSVGPEKYKTELKWPISKIKVKSVVQTLKIMLLRRLIMESVDTEN